MFPRTNLWNVLGQNECSGTFSIQDNLLKQVRMFRNTFENILIFQNNGCFQNKLIVSEQTKPFFRTILKISPEHLWNCSENKLFRNKLFFGTFWHFIWNTVTCSRTNLEFVFEIICNVWRIFFGLNNFTEHSKIFPNNPQMFTNNFWNVWLTF